MYKKLLAGAAALVMVMGASVCPVVAVVDSFAVTASADVMKNDGTFNYQIVHGGKSIQILGLVDTKKKEVNIPEKIEGLPVTEIGNNAFYNKDHDKHNYLKTVSLPDTIETIGESAFAYNLSLTSIQMPKKLKNIGASAFEGCSKIKTIELPEGLESIGDKAFYWCESMPSITIPASVKTIGESVFYNCGVNVDGSNFYIRCYSNTAGEYYAFDNHIGYELIDPEKSKTTMVDNGIYNKLFRYKLINNGKEICISRARLADEKIEIPEKIFGLPITEIGDNAFYNEVHTTTNNVKKIVLPGSIKVIGNGAFADNEALTDINIPKSVRTIGNNAFEVCKSLEKITLPEGLVSIGEQAFTWCQSLTTVTIPESVNKIGAKAFFKCGTITGNENFFINCTKGTAGEKYAKENKIEYKAVAPKKIKGDVNGDGEVTVTDISLAAAHLKGIKQLSDESRADLDGDGKVSITDISKLAAHIKGIRLL